MATHASILAWRIPWTEKPSGLQSMGSQRVGHDWARRQATNVQHTWPQLGFQILIINSAPMQPNRFCLPPSCGFLRQASVPFKVLRGFLFFLFTLVPFPPGSVSISPKSSSHERNRNQDMKDETG